MIKRAPGGGRKPKGGFSQLSSTLTIRIPDDMRKQLESEAAEKNESMAQRLMWHLRQSFNRERDRERDPALHGLFSLISAMANNLSGVDYAEPAEAARLRRRSPWRNDRFHFQAFKLGVEGLLNMLDEPSDTTMIPATDEERAKCFEDVGGPDGAFLKWLYQSPENLAFWVLQGLLLRARANITDWPEYQEVVRTKYGGRPTGYLLELAQAHTQPHVPGFEHLPNALKALGLKPKSKAKDKRR
jgi:hypothetical protein